MWKLFFQLKTILNQSEEKSKMALFSFFKKMKILWWRWRYYEDITNIHFSSKNQNIPMNNSEEKLRKPHFFAFLRGLRGIKNWSKISKLAMCRYYLDWLYCQKIENSDVAIWRKVEKTSFFCHFKRIKGD